jgi:hypothetical protein
MVKAALLALASSRPSRPTRPARRVSELPEAAPETADALPAGQVDTTSAATSVEEPVLAPAAREDDVVGLRQAQEQHLPDITLAALDPSQRPRFPVSVGKRAPNCPTAWRT